MPQTFEDPAVTSHAGAPGTPGDGDPLDLLEVGSRVCQTGDVALVKVQNWQLLSNLAST